MIPRFPRKVKPGDEITAADWNTLLDLVRMSMLLPVGSTGINIKPRTDGTTLEAIRHVDRYLAVANGNITPRSGSTAGTGSVYLVTVAGTTLSTSSIALDVINPSSTTMTSGHGIDSGQYCWVEEGPSGVWIVSPLECS